MTTSTGANADWLHRTVETYGWRLHALALMTNHEHLFVETPEGNLSAGPAIKRTAEKLARKLH